MITVVRRRYEGKPGAKFHSNLLEVAREASRISKGKVDTFKMLCAALDKKEDRLKAAAIRRYAKKHGLELQYHRKPWTFWVFKNLGVALPMGYYAKVKGVLEQIVAG